MSVACIERDAGSGVDDLRRVAEDHPVEVALAAEILQEAGQRRKVRRGKQTPQRRALREDGDQPVERGAAFGQNQRRGLLPLLQGKGALRSSWSRRMR